MLNDVLLIKCYCHYTFNGTFFVLKQKISAKSRVVVVITNVYVVFHVGVPVII